MGGEGPRAENEGVRSLPPPHLWRTRWVAEEEMSGHINASLVFFHALREGTLDLCRICQCDWISTMAYGRPGTFDEAGNTQQLNILHYWGIWQQLQECGQAIKALCFKGPIFKEARYSRRPA